MNRFRYLTVLALALTLLAAACGGDGDTGEYDLVAEGKLTVCSEIPYEPFEYEVDGEYTGFDVEVMQAVADELGLEMEFVSTGFTAITSGSAMAANQCDIAASAITITPEREEAIDFTSPYFDADQSLLVKADSGLASLSDLAGKNLGVQSGTTGEAYAQENNPGAEIVSFENGGELFIALEAGSIDGILQDLPVNGYRSTQDSTVTVVETYTTGEQYGFAVEEEGKEALWEAVNDAIATIKDNGTYDDIFAKWFG
jgi:polar amino acid transport system substrate-binding protein